MKIMYPELTEIKSFEESYEVKLPKHKIVCPRCEGEGKHTNPAVDGNGLSTDDPDLDEEFWDSYRSGVYDIRCEVCNGKNVVDEVAEEVLQILTPSFTSFGLVGLMTHTIMLPNVQQK